MPAKSGLLDPCCPNPECKLQYGSIGIEKQKDYWEGKERKRAKGKTHESYRKKARTRLKPVEYSHSEQQKFVEIIKNRLTNIEIRRESQRKQIEEEEGRKFEKWEVIEELDPNSREFKIMDTIGQGVISTPVTKKANEVRIVVKWNQLRKYLDTEDHLTFCATLSFR